MALGLARDAHQHGLTGAVDVGVQNAHARALGGQRQREVGRRRTLAHAALARGDGDDVLHARQQLHAALHRMGRDLGDDVDRDIAHALGRLGRGDELAAQLRLQAPGRIAELHVESHVAAADLHVAHRARADEVLAGMGIGDAGQRGQQALFGECHDSGLFACACKRTASLAKHGRHWRSWGDSGESRGALFMEASPA